MDSFRKKLRTRQLLLTLGLLFASGAVLLSRNFAVEPSASESMRSFINGFQTGIFIGLFGFLVFFFIRNMLVMRNPDQLKKLYISETDERKLLIMQKSSSDGMLFAIYGLAVGSAVAGSFSDIAFLSILGSCLFVALIRGFLKLYYRTKY